MASLPIQTKIAELQTATGGIDTSALSKISSISPAAASALNIGNIVCEFIDTVASVAGAITDLVADIGSAIGDLADDVKEMLAKFKFPKGFDMSKLLDGVPTGDEIKAFLSKKLEQIGEILTDPIGSLVSALESSISKITEVLSLISKEVAETITKAISAAAKVIDELREIMKTGVQFPDLKKIINGLKPECLTDPTKLKNLNDELSKTAATLAVPGAINQAVKVQNNGNVLVKPKTATVSSPLANATGTVVLSSKSQLTKGVSIAKFMNPKTGTSFNDFVTEVEGLGVSMTTQFNALHDNLYKQAQVFDIAKNSPLFDKKSVEVHSGVDKKHPDSDKHSGKVVSYTVKDPVNNNSTDIQATQDLAAEIAAKHPHAEKVEIEYHKDPVTQEEKARVNVTVSEKKTGKTKVSTKVNGEITSGSKLKTSGGKTIVKSSYTSLKAEYDRLDKEVNRLKEKLSDIQFNPNAYDSLEEQDAALQKTQAELNTVRRQRTDVALKLKNL